MGRKISYVVIALLVVAVAVLGVKVFQEKEVPVAEATGITVVDGLGRKVTIPQAVEHIVSICPPTTTTLYGIGCEDKIMGMDKRSCDFLTKENKPCKPLIGSPQSLNMEMILGLEPDLVVCCWFQTKAIEWLEGQEIPVFAINPRSVDEILDTTKLLGIITGHESQADELVAEMQGKINTIAEKVKDIKKEDRPVVYCERGNLKRPGLTSGHGSWVDDLIFMAGGINLAADESGVDIVLTGEYIIGKDPDIIIVVSAGVTPDEAKNEISNRAGWNGIKAVQNDNIYVINAVWFKPSPYTVKALVQFAQWFYPNLFE